MSFPDANPSPPPPANFLPLPFPGDVGNFCGQFPMNPEHPDSQSQHDNLPPFKRLRNFENNPPSSELMTNGKSTSHIFYKTRMCAKFLGGTCRNGELCTFAHGAEDLREPPPNWQELVREKDKGPVNWNDDQRLIQRMKICKRYYNGEDCPYGEKCTFLHERPMKFTTDLPRQRESSAISIGTTGSIMGIGSDNNQPENKHVNSNSEAFRVKPAFWKTKICSKWEITGQCPFGERCHYAHGHSELHVPIGRIEAEAAVRSGPVQIKRLSIPVADSSSASALAGAPNNEDVKKISKWKTTKKINRIYADWLDGFTPPHEVPGIADS